MYSRVLRHNRQVQGIVGTNLSTEHTETETLSSKWNTQEPDFNQYSGTPLKRAPLK